MKTAIQSPQDALVYLLQGLYYAEKELIRSMKNCLTYLHSEKLKQEMERYAESSDDKLLKLERMFNYFLIEPDHKKNRIVDSLIEEGHHVISLTKSSTLKDGLMASCIQNIQFYKIVQYQTAKLLAISCELDTVGDLLEEIIQWEEAASKKFSTLILESFDHLNSTTQIPKP